MSIDAALDVGVCVPRIVGQAGDGGEFVAGLWIEIRIARAAIDAPVPDAELARRKGSYVPVVISVCA